MGLFLEVTHSSDEPQAAQVRKESVCNVNRVLFRNIKKASDSAVAEEGEGGGSFLVLWC